MAFKDLHKLKKIVEIQKENIEIDHLVVGKDVFSISIYKHLVEKYGEENVRLLTEDKIGHSDLFIKGPSTLRGENNKKLIKELYPNVEFEEIKSPSIFYKDLTWKAFGGRSKSETLKYDEEFFVSSRLTAHELDFYPWLLSGDALTDSINEKAYQVKVKNIHFDSEKFLVECINGTEFKTNKLYFGRSPFYFLKYFGEKNLLSDEFIQFCESTKTHAGLFIKYLFEKPISDLKETMFIPLSYTHEQGHFVGEFKVQNGEQLADFLHYIDEDHMSEEDVSRVIRQLKKSFEKIFEKFLKANFKDFISLEEEMGCLNVDDSLFLKCTSVKDEMLKKMFFLGRSAPIVEHAEHNITFEYSPKNISHLARALLVEANLLKNI
jgi:hypothetical protein